MSQIETLRGTLPEPAKDIKLNLQSVFQTSSLTPQQLWGTAVASAIAARNPELRKAVLEDAAAQVDANVLADAQAAAALMSMNNVYYRFRHMSGKPEYAQKSPRLRMNRMAQPTSNKLNFELFSLAVSAIHGCEMCVQSHDKVVLAGGMTEDQVNDAIRIAAVFHAAAIALQLPA
jgi:lipoyl-dependent peroxiredoxin subunit D